MIRDALDTPVELERGRWGQFEILVDGQQVVSRKGGLVAKLLGRPWPNDVVVVAAVREAMQRPAG